VDIPEIAQYAVYHRINIGSFGHICLDGYSFTPDFPDLLGCSLSSWQVDIANGNITAFFSEKQSHCLTNTTPGSCYQSNFTGEFHY